jgi:biotin carboxyl carrier protein
MKMEHSIKAYADGIVTDIFVKVGEQVENGSLLMKIN